ncbi:hypothetical protein EYF80_033045 [Liparis tanakae]|uniref:Uncharacterized protein n=1 Tax=Liparis tanakae TaxID=230148 RepID=A0A4Z2GU13_9TELE|nr:hypothetical protein EYF80_033045 [Liparis tanakae]
MSQRGPATQQHSWASTDHSEALTAPALMFRRLGGAYCLSLGSELYLGSEVNGTSSLPYAT